MAVMLLHMSGWMGQWLLPAALYTGIQRGGQQGQHAGCFALHVSGWDKVYQLCMCAQKSR